ncbi:MAG: PorP/SprF family type IX secretion system membrane protein [Bacteroidales bacterium]|nr:PorP/SprF family type IX secretion system membrane protein [Bacteroidales bacterium]
MRYIGGIYIILLVSLKISGQDPQFSQFYSNPLYLSPSFAGAVEGSRITSNYRNQWISLPGTFSTYSFSYDHYFSNFNSGVGVMLLKDVAGTGELGTFNAGLQYSFNFNVFQYWQIRPGLQFNFLEHGLAFDKLTFIDQLMFNQDGATTVNYPVSEKARDIDFGTSLLIYSKRLWIGSTIDHLLKPNLSLYADDAIVPYKITVFGGYELVRKGRLLNPVDETMTFTFLFKNQNSISQLDLGVYWHKNPLVLGIWYRGIPVFNSKFGDAVIFLVGYKTRHFNIGYSYDFTISDLLVHARGSHEISMSFKFLMPSLRKKKLGSVPCPEF